MCAMPLACVRRPGIGDHRLAGECLEGQRGDEASGSPRSSPPAQAQLFDQQADEFGGLVGGNAASDAEEDVFSAEFHGVCRLEYWKEMRGYSNQTGQTMAITDWPEDERPRERLLAQGAATLSDAELLALFLRVGVKGQSAVDLAQALIGHFGSLNRLFAASLAEFSAIPGMEAVKVRAVTGGLEMARRALAEAMKQGNLLNTPDTVRDYLRLHLAGLRHEVFLPSDSTRRTAWSPPRNCFAAR